MEWHSALMGFHFLVLLRWQKPTTDKTPRHFPLFLAPARSSTSGSEMELVPEEFEEEDTFSPPLTSLA